MRSISRVVGVSINTVTKLLVDAGNVCTEFHNKAIQNVTSKRVQCDEIWSFCHSKDKNVPDHKKGVLGFGDVWTWTAIDADSKLIVSWLVGNRDGETAKEFIGDLEKRLVNRVQLTTDGLKCYLEPVESAFGGKIDYAILVKLYGATIEGEKRYSPSECVGIRKETISGTPDNTHISTSFIERQNLTMRMSMRRFTRLTNAFSKKLENHNHALALYFVWYNFMRIHKTLRVTPAMQAGLTDKLMDFKDVIKLIDEKDSN